MFLCLCSSESYPHDQQKFTTSLLAKNSPRATSPAVLPTGLMDRLPRHWAICPWLQRELGVARMVLALFFSTSATSHFGGQSEDAILPLSNCEPSAITSALLRENERLASGWLNCCCLLAATRPNTGLYSVGALTRMETAMATPLDRAPHYPPQNLSLSKMLSRTLPRIPIVDNVLCNFLLTFVRF